MNEAGLADCFTNGLNASWNETWDISLNREEEADGDREREAELEGDDRESASLSASIRR